MSHGVVRLLWMLGAVGLIWLVILPWMAGRPRMEAHLEWLDARGVDPSAMYYTELEMMQPIFDRMAVEKRAKRAERQPPLDNAIPSAGPEIP